MNFDDERIAIEKRFQDNWNVSGVPVQYDSAPFTVPQTSSYVALFITNGEGRSVSIQTNPLLRFVGLINVRIFTPEYQGSQLARSLADSAATIFRLAQFSYGSSGVIKCRVPTINRSGLQNGWYIMDVLVPYQRDIQSA